MRSRCRGAAAAAIALVLSTGAASYGDDSAPPAPSPPAPSPAPAAGYSASGTWQLLAMVNSHRRAIGLPALTLDSRLSSIARSWAERMATSGTLAHNEPLFSRSSHRALRMSALGENVGWNYSVRAQDAAFLNSSGHKANIETRTFRAAGFAVVRATDGRIWSTEDFGAPSS